MQTLVVIPALNEAMTVGRVISEINPDFDVLVVDDGSHDDTAKIAKAHGATVIGNQEPKGYDGALTTGIRFALENEYQFAVTMDGDGEIGASSIDLAMEKLRNESLDFVLATRLAFPRFAEKLFALYVSYFWGVEDILCGLKAYRLESFLRFGDLNLSGSTGTALALHGLRTGLKFAQIPISTDKRAGTPAFGGVWRANTKLLKSLLKAIFEEIRYRVEKRDR